MAYRGRGRAHPHRITPTAPPETAEQVIAFYAGIEAEQAVALQQRVDALSRLRGAALIVALDDEEDCVVVTVAERLGMPELLR